MGKRGAALAPPITYGEMQPETIDDLVDTFEAEPEIEVPPALSQDEAAAAVRDIQSEIDGLEKRRLSELREKHALLLEHASSTPKRKAEVEERLRVLRENVRVLHALGCLARGRLAVANELRKESELFALQDELDSIEKQRDAAAKKASALEGDERATAEYGASLIQKRADLLRSKIDALATALPWVTCAKVDIALSKLVSARKHSAARLEHWKKASQNRRSHDYDQSAVQTKHYTSEIAKFDVSIAELKARRGDSPARPSIDDPRTWPLRATQALDGAMSLKRVLAEFDRFDLSMLDN